MPRTAAPSAKSWPNSPWMRPATDGTSAAFDKTKVKQYGLAMQLGDAYGQSSWSIFAASTGWRFMDEQWGEEYHFDDPRVQEAVQYFADLNLVKGHSVPEEEVVSLQTESVFASGRAALVFHGVLDDHLAVPEC